tara:strand:- start:519 stop:743 length:225 start_codon:yes stop_codon:yes gene_type:complete
LVISFVVELVPLGQDDTGLSFVLFHLSLFVIVVLLFSFDLGLEVKSLGVLSSFQVGLSIVLGLITLGVLLIILI